MHAAQQRRNIRTWIDVFDLSQIFFAMSSSAALVAAIAGSANGTGAGGSDRVTTLNARW